MKTGTWVVLGAGAIGLGGLVWWLFKPGGPLAKSALATAKATGSPFLARGSASGEGSGMGVMRRDGGLLTTGDIERAAAIVAAAPRDVVALRLQTAADAGMSHYDATHMLILQANFGAPAIGKLRDAGFLVED